MTELAIISAVDELRTAVSRARKAGKRIGVVPTMGALHAGHLSLVEACCKKCDYTVVTIFVNPTQFGPGEDYQRYPRTLDKDLELLGDYPVDLVFVPTVEAMYPPGSETLVEVGIGSGWEGTHRAGHFRGVATVVLKLFNLVAPDAAFFGQKDYQQTLVVRHMVRDLNLPIAIHVCPTEREADGLAMSSRNAYLNAAERRRARVLFRSLRLAQELFAGGERRTRVIEQQMKELLDSEPNVLVQYWVVAHPETLGRLEEIGEEGAVAMIAAKVGTTRLIDNVLLGRK